MSPTLNCYCTVLTILDILLMYKKLNMFRVNINYSLSLIYAHAKGTLTKNLHIKVANFNIIFLSCTCQDINHINNKINRVNILR